MIVKLQGGLGNQMFEAAYGLTEAKKRNEELFFDTTLLEVGDPKRTYELGPYLPNAKFKDDPSALEGYWQSEKWFDPLLVRETFDYPKVQTMPQEVRSFSLRCLMEGTCFIGVRRADYLWPERLAFHGVMPVSYYDEARSLFSRETRFVAFSDDPDWTWKNLGLRSIRTTPAWDIWLMSLCDHAIIANSSFHFFGAYLGPDLAGRVIAPKKWFAANVAGAEDIVPERWAKL